MKLTSLKPRRWSPGGWIVVLPVAVIVGLVLLLTETTSAAPVLQPTARLSELLFQQQQPLCQTCHPDQYEAWTKSTHAKATVDPAFHEQLAKAENQAACLQCHTTGFDTGSGEFLAEGVTCEACHGAYKQGHPAAETMQLPMESQTCRVCHEAAFQEWETSQHAQQNIDCFDCHNAHSQGVRAGTTETQCAACHNDEQTKMAHSVHGISGVECASCHMAKESKSTASESGVQVTASTHTFSVPADVCNRCHGGATHGGTTLASPALASLALSGAEQVTVPSARVRELEDEVNSLNKRLDSLQSIAVVGLGLAFGIGGFAGLVIGIGGVALLRKRGAK